MLSKKDKCAFCRHASYEAPIQFAILYKYVIVELTDLEFIVCSYSPYSMFMCFSFAVYSFAIFLLLCVSANNIPET